MVGEDEKLMTRCLELARKGEYNVSPNPMVGAVLTYKGYIIGEGYHIRYGGPHAEVNAIASVKDASLLPYSTLYVSLEPCAHHGKTPPCADLIINKQIPRVVIGCADPFPKVAGRGIEKLRSAGVQVTVGVMERECQRLNKRFMMFHSKQRPFVTLKWAQSEDGFLDLCRTGGCPVRFSTPCTALLAHMRRAQADAVMVGTGTALLDDPKLTLRLWAGRQPLRVVLDRSLKLPSDLALFNGKVPTWVFTQLNNTLPSQKPNLTYMTIDFEHDPIGQIIQRLWQNGIQSLLVEGGGKLLSSFIRAGLWDEIYVEKSPLTLHKGVKAPDVSCLYPTERQIYFGREITKYTHHEVNETKESKNL